MAAPYPLDYVSVLVSVLDDGRPRFQGTAFPFIRPGVWLTAGHCVGDWRGPETLALVAPATQRMDGVLRVVPHPKLDIALLTATRSDVVAFPDFGAPTWGAEVSVVGYPEDLYLDDQGEPRPRARLLKGHIQRIESSADEADRRGDLELSFACPGGLSGAPVVLQGGQIVVGVVIGNRDSSTTENSTETLRGAETVTREVARYVSFGAAVDLSRATPWLDTVLK